MFADELLQKGVTHVSPRSISDTLRTHGTVIDKEAVAKYLDSLCDAFLLYKASRYEIKGKGLLQTLNKYDLVDPCFRKVWLRRDMRKDIDFNPVYNGIRKLNVVDWLLSKH